MSVFKLPLSGDVTQTISPMTWWMSPIGSQFGLINIDLGESSKPEIEGDILKNEASYGKQLGIVLDAVAALARHVDPAQFTEAERDAFKHFAKLVNRVAEIKEKHGRQATRLDESRFRVSPAASRK
jgi:hypothetical protein